MRVNVDRLDGVAVQPGEESRRAGRGAEIDGRCVQKLKGLVGPERLNPNDGDALFLEGFLEDFMVLEDKAQRIVRRVIDTNFGKSSRECI